jgi:hypothetical protein
MKLIIENWKRFAEATLNEGNPHLYHGLEQYALEALMEISGEEPGQPLSDIAVQAWDNWSVSGEAGEMVGDENPDHSVPEEDWEASIREALQNLARAGKVSIIQPEPGSSDEDLYALAQQR